MCDLHNIQNDVCETFIDSLISFANQNFRFSTFIFHNNIRHNHIHANIS